MFVSMYVYVYSGQYHLGGTARNYPLKNIFKKKNHKNSPGIHSAVLICGWNNGPSQNRFYQLPFSQQVWGHV